MAIALLCFWLFGIGSVYGFSFSPDEYTYWAYAACADGYDWSAITSLGSYFSYGYSIILFPIFKLCKDAITAYRIAVSLNFFFLFVAFALLASTMRRMIPDKRMPVALFSALAVLAPWNLFYTQMTMTEVFLVCLYIAAGSILFYYLENNRLSTLIWLMLMLMYLYIVHMRTVGILLSTMIVLLIHIFARKEKRWHIPVMLGITAILFVVTWLIKDIAITNVYGGMNPALVADNDYSGQIAKLHYIFTKEGFYDLIISILGKILYLGLATYGLFYWGIYALIRQSVQMFKNIKNRNKTTAQEEFSLFILLSVAAQIMIATIYLLTLGEIHDYTYGRYTELIIPFVMVLGFVVLWRERTRIVWIVTGVLAGVNMLIVLLTIRQITDTGAERFFGHFMVGISYLYDGGEFETGRFFMGAWILGELLTLLVTAAVLFSRSNAKRRYVIAVLAVIQFALAIRAHNVYIAPSKLGAFRDSLLADKISAMQEDGRRIIYIDYNYPASIGILQFMARDTDIQVMEHRDAIEDYDGDITENDLLIFAFDDAFSQQWVANYSHADAYGHFMLLYND